MTSPCLVIFVRGMPSLLRAPCLRPRASTSILSTICRSGSRTAPGAALFRQLDIGQLQLGEFLFGLLGVLQFSNRRGAQPLAFQGIERRHEGVVSLLDRLVSR